MCWAQGDQEHFHLIMISCGRQGEETCTTSIINCLQVLQSNSVVLHGGWLPEKLGLPPAFAAKSCVLLSSITMSPATPTTTVLSVSVAAIACRRRLSSIPAADY